MVPHKTPILGSMCRVLSGLSLTLFAILSVSDAFSASASGGTRSVPRYLPEWELEATTLSVQKDANEVSPKTAKPYSIKFTGRMRGVESDDELDNHVQKIRVQLGIDAIYELLSNLKFHVDARGRFEQGSVHSILEEDKLKNDVVLKEAIVSWKPIDSLELSTGALLQEILETPIFIDDRPFIGARETLSRQIGLYNFGLMFQQLIPTSEELALETVQEEATPTFFTYSVKWNADENAILGWNGIVTYFDYNNLPSNVANESRLYGNTVVPLSIEDFVFADDHRGIAAHSDVNWRVTNSFTVQPGIQYVQNFAAPTGNNKGRDIHLNFKYKASDNLVFKPGVSTHIIQTDAAPAAYNSAFYGHSNRQGYGLHFYVDFPHSNFNVGTSFYRNNVLDDTPSQGNQSFLLFKLELVRDLL